MAKVYMGFILVDVTFVSAMLRAEIYTSTTGERKGQQYRAQPNFSTELFDPTTATAADSISNSELLPNGYHYIVHALRGGDWGRGSSKLLKEVKAIKAEESLMATKANANSALSRVTQRIRDFANSQQVLMLPQIKMPTTNPRVSTVQKTLSTEEMAALHKHQQGFTPVAEDMATPVNHYAKIQNVEVAVKSAFNKFWSEQDDYDPEIKIDFSDPIITPVKGSEDTHDIYSREVELSPKGVFYEFTTRLRLLVYRDEASGDYIYSGVAITTGSEEWTDFKNTSDELTAELYAIAKQRSEGVDVLIRHNKPTKFNMYKDPILKEHAGEWWDWYVSSMQETNSIPLGNQDDAYNKAVEGGFVGSKEDYFSELSAKATKIASDAIASDKPSVWSNIWSGIKGAGEKGFEYVSQWSPAQWVGAYAGYRTVRSIEKTDGIPKWLIYGGLGLGALMILK